MSRIRTFVKRAEQSVAVKELTNPTESREALVKAESELMKGVRKGLFHRNTVARKISRLSQKLKALSLAK
jgi:small subunit ribosomal protein S20